MTHARRRSFLRTVTGLGVVGLAGCSLGGGPSIDTHLTGWEGGFSSEFGSAASLSDDTCVVGAPGARDGDERVELGAAYVFERSEGTWNQQQKLLPRDGEHDDEFGYSVAVAGDTAIVGSPNHDVGGVAEAGAAYIFERTEGSWNRRAKFTDEDAETEGAFGGNVALSGQTALVASLSGGEVYVFERIDGSWVRRTELLPNEDLASFGFSMEIEGDTAVVGDPFPDDDQEHDESVHVFERTDGSWTHRSALRGDETSYSLDFGRSVALSDETVLVGGGAEIDSRIYDSSVYVFEREDGSLSLQTKFTADLEAHAAFGDTLALEGETALIGAPGAEHPDGHNVGATFVFERSDGSWTQRARLGFPNEENRADFGTSVAIDGTTGIVGAPEQGSAYVVDL